ncbi:PucR family transcriptional regulator [Pseudonocardia sp. MCCB 268]|nr:PucR family transcriptional regulator [Pseudonocardia cytotoxica]
MQLRGSSRSRSPRSPPASASRVSATARIPQHPADRGLMDGGQAVSRPTVEQALRAGWRLDGWHTGFLRLGGKSTAPHRDGRARPGAAREGNRRSAGGAGRQLMSGSPDTNPNPPTTSSPGGGRPALDAVHDEIPLVGSLGRPLRARRCRRTCRRREASLFAGVAPFRPGRARRRAGRAPLPGPLAPVRRLRLLRPRCSPRCSTARRPAGPARLPGPPKSSATSAATALGIHRNTVQPSARRNGLQQLLAVDLTRPDDRLILQLACQVLRGPVAERRADRSH